MKKIGSMMMLIAALAAPLMSTSVSRTAEAAPSEVQASEDSKTYVAVKIHERLETTSSTTVRYSMNERSFQGTAITGSSATTLRITEGGRQILEVIQYPNGSGVLKNHRGVSYTTEQLRRDPSLISQFDLFAIATLDSDVAGLIAGSGPVEAPNPCVVNPWIFIACGVGTFLAGYVAKCVEWGCNSDGCWVEGIC